MPRSRPQDGQADAPARLALRHALLCLPPQPCCRPGAAPPLPQAVATLALDWPGSFCRMRAGLVAAQRDVLRRINWRLRLDPLAGVCQTCVCVIGAPVALSRRGDAQQA